MPYKLCKTYEIEVPVVLSTGKLRMSRYGDIKMKAQNSLKASSFKREVESVFTYDDGRYFYQCAQWSRKPDRISLHIIGIYEHPSVGWDFSAVISTSKCEIPESYKPYGYESRWHESD